MDNENGAQSTQHPSGKTLQVTVTGWQQNNEILNCFVATIYFYRQQSLSSRWLMHRCAAEASHEQMPFNSNNCILTFCRFNFMMIQLVYWLRGKLLAIDNYRYRYRCFDLIYGVLIETCYTYDHHKK